MNKKSIYELTDILNEYRVKNGKEKIKVYGTSKQALIIKIGKEKNEYEA